MDILELKNINFDYDKKSEKSFIEGLNLSFSKSSFTALLGQNGSGKSTILKILSGYLEAQLGEVLLWNKNIKEYKSKDRAKLVSFLPQHIETELSFTVKELIEMGSYPYETPPLMTLEEAINITGLCDMKERELHSLSGGEKRRAYLAMTLHQGAGIIILDEPLQNLDIKYQTQFISLLLKLVKEKDITIIMSCHELNIATNFDEIILLKDGQILKRGTKDEIMQKNILENAFETNIDILKNKDKTYINIDIESK